MKLALRIISVCAIIATVIFGVIFYKNKILPQWQLQEYKGLLQASGQNSQFFTYAAGTSFTFMSQDFTITPQGFRQNIILDEEEARNPGFLMQKHYKIAVVGSWITANANAEPHQSIVSQLNLLSKNKINDENVYFYNYAVGGNNLEQMTFLIESILSKNTFDAVLLFIETKDLVYDHDRFSQEKTISIESVFQDANWKKTLSLLVKLRGEINSKFNVDIIPVILPVDSSEKLKYITFKEALNHQGFEVCDINNENVQKLTVPVNEFTWPDFVYSQSLSSDIINCLSIRQLKH